MMSEQKIVEKDGITYRYYGDGQTVFAKGKMKNGKPDGCWEWYWEDGSIMRTGCFDNGETVGEWVTHDRKGNTYKVTVQK